VRSAAFSTVRRFRSVPGLYRIVTNPGVAPQSAATRLAQDPAVAYIEPNFIVRGTTVPNDPLFLQLWGLNNTSQPGVDIGAEAAWNITAGSASVVIATIDSGIDYTHPDLVANVWVNPPGCSGTDSGEYPDDCHGINAITGSGDPMDDYFHGTHVAGSIGAVGNNAIGVTGVNWTSSLLACKFLDSTGSGTTAGAITCLDYVAQKKTAGINIVATNNSWGGSDYSQALSDAIAAQLQAGILFVAAAGNNATNNDIYPFYPCSLDHSNIICVASAVDSISLDFSNYGAGTVHLGAPGEGILSTVLNGQYASYDGTSMATAYVTGVVGLLAAQDSTRDWRALKNLVLAGAVHPTQGTILSVTGGRLRAINSMTCTGSVVEAETRPASYDTISLAVGAELPLEAININCAHPNGNVVVMVQPGGETVTLLDNGAGYDEAAGDGVYTGAWTASAAGSYTLTFPGSPGVVLNVVVDPLLKPGFPASMNLQPDSSGETWPPAASVIVGQIESGAGVQILASAYVAGPLYAWNADGTAAPGWPNYDAGETLQVSLGTFASGAPSGVAGVGYYSGNLYLYNGDGSSISGWPQSTSNNYFPPAIADVGGGGVDAIISAPAYNANGTLLNPSTTVPAIPAGGPDSAPVAVADLNAVGELDFVQATRSLVWASNSQGMLPGFPVPNPVGGAGGPVTPLIGDVDGDGKPNIIVPTYSTPSADGQGPPFMSISIYDNQGVLLRTLTTAPNTPGGVAELADLDGDGIPEIVIAAGSQLYAWKGDGTVMPGFPVTIPSGETVSGNVSIGDVNGDGHPDIAFMSNADSVTGHLHVFDRTGVELSGFPKAMFFGGGDTAIADLNGSGHNDLIVGSTPPGGVHQSIFVYDLQGAGPYGPVEWGQYMGGADHQGYYQTGKNLTATAYLTAQAHGAGTIVSGDGFINCGNTCIHLYSKGATVSLTARAAAGATFTQWLGACAGQANPCNVSVNAYAAVSADFASPVSVSVIGNGAITSSPAGINCPATACKAVFPARSAVTLNATASSGYVLNSWSGDCSGSASPCNLVINAAKNVTAQFVNQFTLSIAHTGAGTEIVTSSPAGINCGSSCSAGFAPNTVLTLSVSDSPTTYVTDWGVPGCTPALPTCKVTLNADTSITITTALKPPLTVSVTGNGSVEVTGVTSPFVEPNVTCTSNCTFNLPTGNGLVLIATPASNSQPGIWSGACSGSTGVQCALSFQGPTTVGVQFGLDPQLSMKFSGSGAGSILESAAGIQATCSASCVQSIQPGSVVSLTATASATSSFVGWSGACSGAASTCTFSMKSNETVGAVFNANSSGSGSGSTASSGGHSGGGALDYSSCAALLGLVLARACLSVRRRSAQGAR